VAPAGEAPSTVGAVTDRIAFEIAAGTFAAGQRLPSVREMAGRYGINASTVQVVLARLRAAGFVEAVPRAGFVVRDIERYGGIDTWRYLFRFAQRLPERATRLFADFLATRQVLLLEVGRAIAREPRRYDARPVRAAFERLEMVVAGGGEPADVARAELEGARIMMAQLGRPVLLALSNSIGDILLEVPAVVKAMYAEPQFNLAIWRGLLDSWEAGALRESDLQRAEAAFHHFNEQCVERFRANLTAQRRGGADQRPL